MLPSRSHHPLAHSIGIAIFSLVVIVTSATVVVAQDPAVSIELGTERGFPIGGEQKWVQVFRDLKLTNVRIRAAAGTSGRGGKCRHGRCARYRVVGILTARNRLELPGKSFAATDRGGIAGWFRELRERGVAAATGTPSEFGLLPKELVQLHEDVAVGLVESTKGKKIGEVVKAIEQRCGLPITAEGSAAAALAGREPCLDELKGISCGTALAAAIRPLGLVMVPKPGRRGAKTTLTLVASDEAEKHWPIGWPPSRPPGQLSPSLFKFLPAEINDFKLSDALASMQQRVEVPFLWDHNNILRKRIDLSQKVSFGPKRTFYKKIIDDLLFQARLTSDLRMDEAGHPILWITPQ